MFKFETFQILRNIYHISPSVNPGLIHGGGEGGLIRSTKKVQNNLNVC